MKNIWEKYNSVSLILRIFIGLVIGVILGIVVPKATVFAIFGQLFVGSLKAIAPLLVFALVVSAILGAKKGGVGKRFRTVIFFYMISTLFAAFGAVLASFLFPVTLKLTEAVTNQNPPQGIAEVLGNLLNNMVMNPITAISSANYVCILFWSVLFGIALKTVASPSTDEAMKQVSDSISQIVKWIISFAPFGIMGFFSRMPLQPFQNRAYYYQLPAPWNPILPQFLKLARK